MRREVQVRPGFAESYPGLSPDRWYSAASVAALLRSSVRSGFSAGPDGSARLIDPAHFRFRGGHGRSGSAACLRTRLRDRHADLSTL